MVQRLRQQLTARTAASNGSHVDSSEGSSGGRPFELDCWWMQPPESGEKSPGELFESATPWGAVDRPARLERARRDFTSAKAVKMLSLPRGEAHTPVSREVSQDELPPPAPPRLTSATETERHVQETVKMPRHETVELVVGPREPRPHELILSTAVVHKAGSKPRFCADAKPSKEPTVEHVERRQCGTGTAQLNDVASPQDLGVSFDFPSGRRQCRQTRASADRELTLMEVQHAVEVHRRLERPLPANLRTHRWRGRERHLVRPITVSSGNPRAVEHFRDRQGLPVSQTRQHGMRLALQVDDSCVTSRRGAADTLICGAICIAATACCGHTVHVTGEKRPGWPSDAVEFDRSLNCFALTTRCSPPDKDKRHQNDLSNLVNRHDTSETVSMLDLLSVVMQQQIHKQSHWPTAQLTPRLRAHVSREQKRLREESGSSGGCLAQKLEATPSR